jgi:NET1-associated nuclear protein 1 (U3 small nucleolar RNA-associated protein 17)
MFSINHDKFVAFSPLLPVLERVAQFVTLFFFSERQPSPSSAMVPSSVNSSKARRPHEPQMSQNIGKTRRRHRPKSKRREILGDLPAQASTSVNAAEPLKSWSWVSITEPPTTKHPPIFTKDGKCVIPVLDVPDLLTLCTPASYFFSIVGSSVKIYSTTTGLVVSTLSAKRGVGSHTNAITSAVLNPHNAFQLITGSLDGHIKVWDLLDGVLLQTIGVGNPVCHVAAHERWKDFLFVAIARPSKKRKANGTSPFSLKVTSFPDVMVSFRRTR